MKQIKWIKIISIVIGVAFFNLQTIAQDYKINETGQTECYDDEGNTIECPSEGEEFYGQDAQYDGFEFSFIDNGDGTVTDENTGLMWQQTPPSDGYGWQDAGTYCENLELAGHDDWRLPTLKELFAIGNYSEGWPYLDENYFDIAGESASKDEQYWAQENYVGVSAESGSNGAWGVNHGTGHIKTYPSGAGPGGGKRVRAVRGTNTAINDYEYNGDGTITDNATGLMWSQADNGDGLLWVDALAYAEDSELAGYDDWRLPNIKELQSIVDYSYSPTATDPDAVGPAIDTIFDCTPIINEAGNDDFPYFWSSTSARFQAGTDFYFAWYVAFGMAVNGAGEDFHGAGAVRYDTKALDGPSGEDGERYYNYVRLVREIGTTGIGESNRSQDQLKIYPNPAYETLTIDMEEDGLKSVSLMIFNTYGQLVLNKNVKSDGIVNINVSDLPKGLYLLSVNNLSGIATGKFYKY